VFVPGQEYPEAARAHLLLELGYGKVFFYTIYFFIPCIWPRASSQVARGELFGKKKEN